MFLRRLHPPIRAFHDLRTYKEDARWQGWQVVVGIETHAQIKSRRKLFSESFTASLEDVTNTRVSLFDAAYPGTLPKLNPKCVDLALRTALALKCQIATRSSFDRKHYFYADLPSGYQITQQYAPLAKNGRLEMHLPKADPFSVRIKQIQLEQDTAKTTFNARTQTSHIDLNRAGTGLMEIVSEPDIRSPEEAGAYVRALQALVRAVGSSDGNMEQGSLRCDVNVSVNKMGEPPGTRCEIKNLNSVKFMMAAITHEIHRQRNFLENNPDETVPQETRGFNEDTFETFRLRSKEDAPDYRYMPDPNLGVLVLGQARIQEIQRSLPPLPSERRAYLLQTYPTLQDKQQSLDVLLKVDSTKEIGFDGEASGGAIEYFEQLCQGDNLPTRDSTSPTPMHKRDPVFVLNWLTHDLLGQLAAQGQTFSSNPLTPCQFGEILDLVKEKCITGTSAKYLLRYMLSHPSGKRASDVATELQFISPNLSSPSAPSPSQGVSSSTAPKSSAATNVEDPGTLRSGSSSVMDASSLASPGSLSPDIRKICEEAVIAMPNEVTALRTGKSKGVLNKLVGFVMKQSRGRADALAVREALEDLIFLSSY